MDQTWLAWLSALRPSGVREAVEVKTKSLAEPDRLLSRVSLGASSIALVLGQPRGRAASDLGPLLIMRRSGFARIPTIDKLVYGWSGYVSIKDPR